jgi:hypothetical protein
VAKEMWNIIKSNTVLCHFVSAGFTDNSLEYSVIKKHFALIASVKKPLVAMWGGSWVAWAHQHKW